MKKEQSPPEPTDHSHRSFSVAIEQMAQLLRSQVKLKERAMRVLSTPPTGSFENSIEQIAKLLRSQVHPVKPAKKRSWKKSPSKRSKH